MQAALQTANDMEVLYMDTQRKFSELQTMSREKEAEYEAELQRLRTEFKELLDSETDQKKQLSKELVLFHTNSKFKRGNFLFAF